MKLSAPTILVFLISVILAGLTVAAKYFGVSVPYIGSHLFQTLLAAYVILLIGNLFRGV